MKKINKLIYESLGKDITIKKTTNNGVLYYSTYSGNILMGKCKKFKYNEYGLDTYMKILTIKHLFYSTGFRNGNYMVCKDNNMRFEFYYTDSYIGKIEFKDDYDKCYLSRSGTIKLTFIFNSDTEHQIDDTLVAFFRGVI